MKSGFVAVAIHLHDRATGRPAIYGPCDSHARAQQVCTLLGLTDATVWATRVMPLIPPAARSPAPQTPVDPEMLTAVPDAIVDIITATPDAQRLSAERAVVFAILDGAPRSALVIGPFTTAAAAQRWRADRGLPGAGSLPTTVVSSWILPLEPLTGDTGGDSPDGAEASPPAVVRIAATDGTLVYGPFTDVLHATAWFHDVVSRLRLTNVHGASAYPVGAPFDVPAQLISPPGYPRRPAGPAAEPPPRPHVVVVDDPAGAVSAAVGWFGSHDAAHAWWRTQRRHLPDAVAEIHELHHP